MKSRVFSLLNILSYFVIYLVAITTFSGKLWGEKETDSSYKVMVWDPPFNKERSRKSVNYQPLQKASKKWRICVSIPHLKVRSKDAYWLGVNYGIIDQAKKLGVGVQLFEAGGYANLDMQKKQIRHWIQKGMDGLIVSAIEYDGLNDVLSECREKGIPVVVLINGVNTDHVTANVSVSYWDNANVIGKYLLSQHPDTSKEIKVAWFPGPKGAFWSEKGNKGFQEALTGSHIKIVKTVMGSKGNIIERKLVEKFLDETTDVDYIIGNTKATEEALDEVRKKQLDHIKVVPYYYGPVVHVGLKRGEYEAAATDQQTIQARLAMDVIVRILEKQSYYQHVAPEALVVYREKIREFDAYTSLPPEGFRPIFSINSW